jgi:integrase
MKARGEGRIFLRNGSVYWWCAYFLRGKEYRESTGTTDREKAEKFLKRRMKEVGADQIGKGTFIGPQQERVKVGKLLDALEADYQLRGKDSHQFWSHIKHTRAYFGPWRAAEVTPEAVDSYILEEQRAGLAPATINRRTQLLAQAFRLAIERNHLSTGPRIRHLSEKGNTREGFFTNAEVRALIAYLPEYLKDFVLFGYLTGWRKREIVSLRWEDVEGEIIRLRGGNAKNGEGRPVTLSGELGEMIGRRKAARQVKTEQGIMLSASIFHLNGRPVGDFKKAWASACVAANLGRFNCRVCKTVVTGHRCGNCGTAASYSGRIFHDFRRTSIRNMVRAGVPERVAMSISGHKTRAIFDRYNIVNEDDLREAMQRTQQYLKETEQKERLVAITPVARAGR